MSIVAHSKTVEFEVKPFPTSKSTSEQIKGGLLSLYKNNISETDLNQQISLAQDFQNSVYETLDQQIAANKMMKAKVKSGYAFGFTVRETVVTFSSLVQRPNDHAANRVIAKIYEPNVQRPFCEYKHPTAIFLHHIKNELEMIEDLGKVMASGLLHQSGIIVVLHMPHYGERRQGDEEFLNSDLQAFRNNMKQLILDVHVLRNFLETRKNINTEKLALTGISLGAVMGLTVGAFDQGFTGYGHLVGGVDVTNILYNRAANRPDSEVAKAMKDVKLDESYIRSQLATVDPMTWLHRYQNKKILAVNASQDDIINYDISVKPMLDTFKANNNDVRERLNNDKHSPSGSFFTKMRNAFYPLLNFIIDGSPSYNKICPAKNRNDR